MLRTRNVQPSLWESVLPEVCLRLPAELQRVDAWLDDERFFAPFVPFFDPRIGRPSIPMETYLRLMFLKHRYRLGYESLCTEVSDSISWRRFCRIDIDGRLPHPTTLMKLTTRCGAPAIAALNEALLATAVQARVVKTGKVRADTTVVSANVDYPTDSGLLARAVVRMSRLVRRIRAVGAAPRTPFRDRTRAAGRRVRSIAAHLRLRGAQARDEAQATVARITGELADLTEATAVQAGAVLRNARRALRRSTGRMAGRAGGRLRRAVNELAVILQRASRVITQTRVRLAGGRPDSATRLRGSPHGSGPSGTDLGRGSGRRVLGSAGALAADSHGGREVMEVMVADPYQAVRRLLAAAHRARPEDLPALAMSPAADIDADAVVLYLVDYSQQYLVPMLGSGTPPRQPVAVDATIAGRVFAIGRATYQTDPARVWLPLVDGTERLGVLEVVPRRGVRRRRRGDDAVLASLFAELLVARRVYGDAIERIRRREPMQVAAEIVWSLLPPLTFATNTVTVTGVLEPCYDMGGDTFDYAVHGDVLHLAMFDALGHGMAASTLTAVALSAYRNARRTGLDLSDTCKSVDKWVAAQFPDRFATATLAELDTATGVLSLVCAGHPSALLLRNGQHVKTLPGPTYTPLGLGLPTGAPVVVQETLQPGDQVLFYTDGVTEARTVGGEFFGVQRLVGFVTRALADHLPAPETMRRLVHAILAHQHEQLQDDASALLVHWHPDAGASTTAAPPSARGARRHSPRRLASWLHKCWAVLRRVHERPAPTRHRT